MLSSSIVISQKFRPIEITFLSAELFKKYKFTHVAHLAAQAGVRYSLKNPLAYVKSNVECFVVLLEVMRNYPGVKLVYASSSSVYGRNTKGAQMEIWSLPSR
jgi:UDP-glucuronate 4-epimerase